LDGFSKPWETFVQGAYARENALNFENLWDIVIQEETRRETSIAREEEAQDQGLTRRVRKGGKKGHNEHSCSSNHGKKDLIHVKCFNCRKMDHYASKSPKEKKAKNKQQQK